jgi:hypothetical protein
VLWADTSEVGDAVIPAGGSAGEVLVKQSASDYDSAWQPHRDVFPYITGTSGQNGFLPYGFRATGSTTGPTAGVLYFSPVVVPEGLKITSVSFTNTIAAAAAATARVGFYDITSLTDVRPGALVFESTTVAADVVATKTVTGLSITTSNPFMWACFVVNSSAGAGTWRSMQIDAPGPFGVGNISAMISDRRVIPQLSSVTGVFPDPAAFPNWNAAVAIAGSTTTALGLVYGVV